MKKAKIVFWVIVLIFVGIFFYSNKDFFMGGQILKLNLHFREFKTPEFPLAVLFLIVFLVGFLIAYFSSLYEQFKTKKAVKNLQGTMTSQSEEISTLKKELESLRPASPNIGDSSETSSADFGGSTEASSADQQG